MHGQAVSYGRVVWTASEGWRQSQSLWNYCGLDAQRTKVRGTLLPGGHRLSASAFGGPESRSQASPLWVNAVGMWLGSTQSTFALPPFLVVGRDTININGFCNSILLHFEVDYSLSPSFQAGSLQSTLPTPPVLVLYPLHRCLEQLEKLTEQYVQRGHLPQFSNW